MKSFTDRIKILIILAPGKQLVEPNEEYPMFRRHCPNPYDKSEMSFEQTLSYLSNLQSRPEEVSTEAWNLIKSDQPPSNDRFAEIYDRLIDDLGNNIVSSVLTLEWSGYGMAHSGIKVVSKWGPLFIFTSSDHDDHGPFETIEDVLGLEYFLQEGVPGGELWFDATIVPEALAMKIAFAMCGDDDETVKINDVIYVRSAGTLSPMPID